MAQDIPGGADFTGTIGNQNPGAINPWLVRRCAYCLYPREKISSLFRQQPAALLLIEEHNRSRRKTLSLRGRNSRSPVRAPQCRSVFTLELRIQPPVEQNQEAEAASFQRCALARPAVVVIPRRVVQPIAGIGENLPQLSQMLVAGIIIPVEARGLAEASLCQAKP